MHQPQLPQESAPNQFNMSSIPGQPAGQYPPQQQAQYPPQQQGQYPPQQQAQYPPQQQEQYPPQQQGQYPPQQQGQYPHQQQGQYPPQQQGQYPPQQQAQYPPQQQAQYPPQQQQGQFPPQQQPGQQSAAQQAPPQQQPGQQSAAQQAPTGAWQPSAGYQYDGEVPDQDVDENIKNEPTAPTAQPQIDAVVPGYEEVAFANEKAAGPPPAYTEAIQDTTIDTTRLPSITVEDAKEALEEYVSQQCCYGSGAAKEMDIKDIKLSSAFHYSLETYTEARSTKWKQVPYSGGFVDGPYNGPAPGPWEIQCGFDQTFKNQVVKMEIPHTASVKRCHLCFGRGFQRCHRCRGRGKVRCSSCSGSGSRMELMSDGNQRSVTCSFCGGSGRKRCITCTGFGSIQCHQCKGFGQLRNFIELTVTFTNRLDDHIIERTDMPDHLIRDVEGDMILEQVDVRVGSVVGFIENEINQQSFAIVQKHATSWPNERILQQRQKLRVIPVCECKFKFKDDEGRFWVYGKQRSVYTADYPHTCCCCKCTIL